jgi:proteasome regulatory subunit
MPSEDKLDRVVYSYTTESNQIDEENQVLRETVSRLDDELRRLKTPALMVCEVQAVLDGNKAIINIPNGNRFMCNLASDCGTVVAGDQVLVEQKNLNIIEKVPLSRKYNVEQFVIIQKPSETWGAVGGLGHEVNEVREVIELPLTKPELFTKIGISPPKGILLYGPPGTGKTLLAKAVAHSTNATFIQVTGSELVQKFIGEGAKLVKDIFELARKKAPSLVFIDEIDALAATRMEMGTSGEREVNRTFMQLLAEIDGFKPLDNVKIIGATNRKDVLDPAVLRPGRLDRLIHVDVPDSAGLLEILKIHTRKTKTAKALKLASLVDLMEGFSGAEVKAAVTEAGYFAIRDGRTMITKKDFVAGVEKVKQTEKLEGDDYLGMFG